MLFYPCVLDCKTASISKRVSAKPMTRNAAENFLKRHYLQLWRRLEAIPQPVNHPHFKGGMMREYEQARNAGVRVFFELSTNTVRTCPENYCIAVRDGDDWRMFLDGALKHKEAALVRVVETIGHWSSGGVLAHELGKVLGPYKEAV